MRRRNRGRANFPIQCDDDREQNLAYLNIHYKEPEPEPAPTQDPRNGILIDEETIGLLEEGATDKIIKEALDTIQQIIAGNNGVIKVEEILSMRGGLAVINILLRKREWDTLEMDELITKLTTKLDEKGSNLTKSDIEEMEGGLGLIKLLERIFEQETETKGEI